jgi:5'-nucleotidase
MRLRKLRILVDMDSILADFLGGLVDSIEAHLGYRMDPNNIKEFYRMQDALPPEVLKQMKEAGKTIEDYFFLPGFFRGLKVIPGAKDAIRAFLDEGHEVVVVTAPSSPTSTQEKLEWMREHFPEIPAKNICVFPQKHMIKGDVLIDDAAHNASAYIAEWPKAHTLTLAYAYNEKGKRTNYNGRYDGKYTTEGWKAIVEHVRCVAMGVENPIVRS